MSRATLASLAALGFLSAPAAAHGVLEGVGDFYAGLLHPLAVSGEALALVAIGLALGASGLAACRAGLPALASGLAVGLGLGQVLPAGPATPLLLAIALVAGALVAAGLRLPPPAGVALAGLGGMAVGIDARPEAEAILSVLVASGASVLGGTALAIVVVALVLGREHHWQRVAVQTAGSWIAASCILYYAWLATRIAT